MVNKSMIVWTNKPCKNVPRPQKPIFLGLESDKSENQIIFLEITKIYEICSWNVCAEWVRRFSKRACEVPNLSKTDLG